MGILVRRLLTPVLVRLGSRAILTVGGTLFVLNMLIPDPLPLVDEFLMLAATILFSRWAKAGAAGATGEEGLPRRSREAAEAGAPKHVGRGSTHA